MSHKRQSSLQLTLRSALLLSASIGALTIICYFWVWAPINDFVKDFRNAAYPQDCFWHATAEAWIDNNENGIWEGNELPLAGVEFLIDDVANRKMNVEPEKSISDSYGQADLSIRLTECTAVSLEIYAKIPADYRPTTQMRMSSIARKREGVPIFEGGSYAFGFVPIEP
jgi:hypothetical protein